MASFGSPSKMWCPHRGDLLGSCSYEMIGVGSPIGHFLQEENKLFSNSLPHPFYPRGTHYIIFQDSVRKMHFTLLVVDSKRYTKGPGKIKDILDLVGHITHKRANGILSPTIRSPKSLTFKCVGKDDSLSNLSSLGIPLMYQRHLICIVGLRSEHHATVLPVKWEVLDLEWWNKGQRVT